MKKVWNGFYEDYLFENNKITVEFTITAELENGSFKGKVYENEFSKFTGDSIDVQGFIEGNLISFVTKYPYLFAYDSKGKILIDKNEKGHEVIYEGYFNEATGIW